jgi:hypothetical protein
MAKARVCMVIGLRRYKMQFITDPNRLIIVSRKIVTDTALHCGAKQQNQAIHINFYCFHRDSFPTLGNTIGQQQPSKIRKLRLTF